MKNIDDETVSGVQRSDRTETGDEVRRVSCRFDCEDAEIGDASASDGEDTINGCVVVIDG